jgi:hypothetical protein
MEVWNEILRSLVRPVTTLAIIGVICHGVLVGQITMEAFLPIATLIIKWWFDERTDMRKAQEAQRG